MDHSRGAMKDPEARQRRWLSAVRGAVLTQTCALLLGSAAAGAATEGAESVPSPKRLYSVEPFDASFIALVDADVLIAPSKEAAVVSSLIGGMTVRVTARINGAGWYRVVLESGESGFVQEHLLRDIAGPAEQEGGQQVAARPLQGPVDAFQDCEGCPRMVRLESGSFIMGSNYDELTEAPAHEVRLARPFALGQHEVTVGEWLRCVAAGACAYAPKGAPDDAPVRNISWDDAQEYLRWLTQVTGKPYRLPSEAEWEYAARSGSSTKYWWGNEVANGYADCRDCREGWQKEAPAAVTALEANPFGFHGMTGGVAEWTADCWSRNYKDAPADGSARNRPGCKKRVLRGGSWRDPAAKVRASARRPQDANIPQVTNGLRVAQDLP